MVSIVSFDLLISIRRYSNLSLVRYSRSSKSPQTAKLPLVPPRHISVDPRPSTSTTPKQSINTLTTLLYLPLPTTSLHTYPPSPPFAPPHHQHNTPADRHLVIHSLRPFLQSIIHLSHHKRLLKPLAKARRPRPYLLHMFQLGTSWRIAYRVPRTAAVFRRRCYNQVWLGRVEGEVGCRVEGKWWWNVDGVKSRV